MTTSRRHRLRQRVMVRDDAPAFGDPGLGLGGGAVVNRDGVTSANQCARPWEPHGAQPNEAMRRAGWLRKFGAIIGVLVPPRVSSEDTDSVRSDDLHVLCAPPSPDCGALAVELDLQAQGR